MPHAHDTPKASDRSASAGTTARATRSAALSKREAARRLAAQRRAPRVSRLLAWLLSVVLGNAGLAYAQVPAGTLPTGGQVMVGSGQVQQSANLLIVNQGSVRLGMDWQSFNIGSGATVEFRQPGADSIALNRVVGNNGSEIYGRLRANGQVFLTNPNGVLFAPGAQVDVGGLVASTLDLSQQDFAAGRYAFRGDGQGAVINQGRLRANAGGYLALFGNRVDNQGDVSVDTGSVVLASGRAATVSISGSGLISAVVTPGEAGSVSNSGSIAADGGTVTLSAHSAQDIAQSLVNNSGIVRANTLVERNGEVWITGDQVTSSGQISADATGAGNAGRVVVKGGMEGGSLQAGGTITARAEAGRGGEVETSAAHVSIAPDMRVNTLSGSGQGGTWTIDPTDFTVAAGSAALTSSGIGADTLSSNLDTTSVSLATAAGGSEPGDIHVQAPVNWTSSQTLTLTAARDININANLTASGIGAALVLAPGAGGAYTLASGARITLSGSQSTLQISGIDYTMIRSLADLQAINTSNATRSGSYALAANLDASASSALNGGLGFDPIGNQPSFSSNNSFRGRFDGLGNDISGLVINRPTSDYVGLFGTTHDATLSNLRFVGGSFAGRTNVGALAGYVASNAPTTAPTTITNISSSATVGTATGTQTAYAGGLVGRMLASGGQIDRSSASGAVTSNASNGYAGGLVGEVTVGGVVSNSSASGNVVGADYAGGLIGRFGQAGAITNVQATGNVTGTNYVGGLVGQGVQGGGIVGGTASGNVSGPQYTGGLAGYLDRTNVSGSSASGQVDAVASAADNNTVYVGGLVGYYTNSLTGGQISNSSATGAVTSAAPHGYTGGLVGYFTSGSVAGSSATGIVQATHASANNRYVGGLVGYFDGTGSMSNVSASGNVSGGLRIGGLVGFYGSTGNLSFGTATGSATGSAFGTSQYVGGLIGQMSSGGAVSDSQASGQITTRWDGGGLIGYTASSGTITDSRATGNVVGTASSASLGGLVGYASSSGTITNSSAAGNVSGGQYAGGLAGQLNYTNVVSGTATGNVTVTNESSVFAGGLVGYFYNYNTGAQISTSSATGAVFGDAANVYGGGLVGYLVGTATVSGSTAGGKVTGRDSANLSSSSHYVGGLVGYFQSKGIADSAATGTVVGNYYTGGLVGYYYGDTPLSNSSATGDVSGTYYVGGLVGYQQIVGITNGFASGNVISSGTGYTGGLVGYIYTTAANNLSGINDSRATGNVSGGNYVGGLIGHFDDYTSSANSVGGIANSSASGNVSGASRAGGLVGSQYSPYTTNTVNISNSHATGNVQGAGYAGGLAGEFNGYAGIRDSYASGNVLALSGTSERRLGGLVGQFNSFSSGTVNGVLTRSYATGSVSLDSTATLSAFTNVWAGGLVGTLTGSTGTQTSLTDSYATGAVTLANSLGRLRAGGLVGSAQQNLARSYATGAVSATGGNTRVTGGLVAELSSGRTVTSSFWATDTTGQTSSAGGTASTLAALKSAATFPSDWDLASAGGTTQVWRVYEGQTTPLLRNFLTPLSLTLANISKVYDGTTSLGNAAISVSGTAVANPERILVSGVSANVGTHGLTASNLYSVQDGYDLSVTGTANLAIGQRPLTVDGLVADKVYDGTTAATLAPTPQFGGLVSGEDLLFQPGTGFAVQFASKTAGTGKAVNITGGYTLADGTKGLAGNYLLPSATTTTADITPATLTAGSFSATNRSYDGTTSVAVSATSATLGGVMPGDAVGVDLSSVNSGTMADRHAGTTKPVTVAGVALSGADVGNYVLAGIDNVTVDIVPKALTVNGITATDRQYNRQLSVNLTTGSTSLSGLESGDQVLPRLSSLTGTVADKNVANGKAVTVNGLGLRGPDAANYTPQQSSVSVNITPRVVTMFLTTTSQTNRVYDGTTTAAVAPYNDWTFNTSSLWNGDDVTLATTSIGYSDKNVAFNTSGVPTSKTITASGFSISGTDAFNYTLVNTSATITGTISPKPLTVSGVSAANRNYDGTRDVAVSINGATVDTTAVVSGDVVSVATPGTGTVTGQTADKNVGTAKAVTVPGLTLTGADAGNYSITSGSGGGVTVNITKKDLTAIYTAVDKVYNGDVYATMNVTSTDIVSGDQVISYIDNSYCGSQACGFAVFTEAGRQANGSYTTSRHAGTAKPVVITFNQLVGTDAGNYNLLNPTGSASASITPKPVNLAFSGVSKVYDGSTDATVSLNLSGSGVFSIDALTSTQTAAYTGTSAKNAGTGKPISVTGISLTGANAGNYTVGNTTATTTGAVTAKPITISGITATDRAYDGTTTVAVTAGTVTSAGFVSTDTVAVALPVGGLSSGTIADKNVGTNKPVTVTGLTLTGADAANYSIDSSGSGITVNISAFGLTPTYSSVSRVYNGGVTASVTSTTTGIATGDSVTFNQQAIYTGTNARDAGTGKPISVSNISLGGSAATNYSLLATTVTTTGDITPKPVTATYTGGSRVYNGLADVSAAVVGSSLQFVAGDSVGLSETASFTGDGSAGVNKPVSISNIAITGNQAANYSLVANSATTNATITPRPLGVTGITATNRVYDGTATVAVNVSGATVDTTSVLAGDVVSVTLPPSGISTGTLADRHVGNGKQVAITGLNLGGSSAPNYSLVGATGLTVNITPKSLTAVWSGVNMVYDGTADAGVTGSSGDIFALDSASLGFSAQGVFAGGKDVGSGKAVNVLGGFLTGASANDYTLTNTTGSTTADITPRTLTANYSGGSKVYDGNTVAVVTGTLSNRVAGDTVTATQTAQFSGANARNVGSGKPISVSSIALGGVDAGNYALANTTDTTSGSITPKPITVSGLTNVLATDRVYDGTRVVDVTVPVGVTLVPNSSDIITGDTVTIDVPVSGVTTGTVATKNAGNGKTVAVDGLTLSGTDAANYSIGGTAGITVNIAPKALAAVYSGVNKVYDGRTDINVTGTSTDIIGSDSLLIRGNGVLTGSGARDVGTSKAVNVTSASLAGTDAGNYTLTNTTGSTTADVTQRPVTPAYVGGSRVYDGSTGAPVTSSTANFITGDNVSLSEAAVFTGASARNAGTGKAIQVSGITLSGSDAANYSLTANIASTTGTITPKPITLTGLTGITATDRDYDGTLLVSVNVASTGTIAINPADIVTGDTVSVVAPVSGLTTGTLVNKNAGTNKAVVVAGLSLTGTDAANYSVAATNGVTVNIAPKSLTALYTGVDRVYDGTALATVVGTSADLVAGDGLTISGSGIFGAGKDAGTNKAITVSAGTLGGADAVNYSLLNTTGSASATITPKVVTAVYIGGTRVYDGTTAAPVTGTLSGQIAGDSVSLAQGAVFTGVGAKNVGAGKAVDVSGIALSGTDAANYSLSASAASTTASITPKPLGILGLTGVAATDRTYDGTTTVAVTVSTSGTVTPNPADLIAGDVVTISAPPTGTTTGNMPDKNVGTNKPVAVAGLSLGGADAGNYSVASTSGVTVNVTPKSLTAAYAGLNRTYDGTTSATAIGSSADIVGADIVLISAAGVFSGSGGRNAGVSKSIELVSATLSGTDAVNYLLVNTTGTTTADITPRQVDARYAGGTRVYDGTTAAPVSRNVSGFLVGDAVSLSETAVFSGTDAKNAGTGKAVQVSAITLSGTDAGNYALLSNSASTTGTITPRPLNVTGLSGISAVDREYDGTNTVQVNVAGALGSAGGDVVAGDDLTVNLPGAGVNSGVMADKHAGQNKDVVLSGLSLSGTDAPNYFIAGTAGLSVTIAPRALSGVYSGVNREYDGTTAASVLGSSSGIVVGDAVLINAAGVFSGSGARNVGTAKPIAVTGAALSGADAGNYLLASTSGVASADITARLVTPAYTGGSRAYDGTTTAPVTSATSDFIAGDAVAIAETAAFSGAGAKNVGTGKTIDVTGISLTGADAFNYALVGTSASTAGSITPRPLNVTGLTGITAVDRNYDGTRAVQVNLPGSLGNAGGDVIAGDDVTVNVPATGLGGGTMADKNAGQNKPVALNGLFLSGADAPNYAIAGTAGVTVNIATLAVTLTGVSAVDRVYDGTTAVAITSASGSLSGVLAGDDLQLPTTGVTGTMADKHAGQGKAVSVSGLTFSGADLANYTVAGGSGLTVNIARRTLTPGVTVADKTYDGDTGATVTLSDDRVAGDALTLTAGGAVFASANAGNGLAVTVSGLAGSGADAANYQLGATPLITTANINRAPLSITASLTKVYGDTLSLTGTEFSALGLVAGETLGQVTLSSAGTAATALVTATPYGVSVSNATGGTFNPLNYDTTHIDGQLTVTPRPLTVAANSLVRFAGTPNPAGSFGLSTSAGGLVNGDTLTPGQTAAPPAGSDGAPGVSVFSLLPASVSFASGTPANYALSYSPGLLLVLPQPPLVGETDAGAGNANPGGVGLLDDPEARARAEDELQRVAARTGSGTTPATLPERLRTLASEPLTPDQIDMILSADGQRLTLPELRKLPLITFNPLLRRLLQADGAR